MKKVQFNETPIVYSTYGSDQYNRMQIDSILYLKNYNRVSNEDWNKLIVILDLYKLYEMPVHPDSIQNNSYYIKKIIYSSKI